MSSWNRPSVADPESNEFTVLKHHVSDVSLKCPIFGNQLLPQLKFNEGGKQMKQYLRILLSVLLVSMLLAGCVTVEQPAAPAPAPAATEAPAPEPAPTEAPAPEPTATPEPRKSVSGTVISIAPNDITVNIGNGTTINFTLSALPDAGVRVGDEVEIDYDGDVLNSPEATKITITKEAVTNTLSGTVMMVSEDSVFVQISSMETFGFVLNDTTQYSFAADPVTPPLAVGDQISVTYDGDLLNSPTATDIMVLVAVADRGGSSSGGGSSHKDDGDQTNKHLTGYVTDMGSDWVKIRTDKNRTWKFYIGDHTKETGSYEMEVGSKIRVTYDGYASDSPDAKEIRVVAPRDPTPTPKPTDKKTTSGRVVSWGGQWLSLDNGFGCDTTYATISGDGTVDSRADVTYYEDDNGVPTATKNKFTPVLW